MAIGQKRGVSMKNKLHGKQILNVEDILVI